ncbi:hypothetical protein CIPAW_14G113100 [Carya illinoinensis]|uniref:Uncharacterized protein n=1 Tax=Carya illinoinensis TaxID=32201 RepID=A0A8T1NDV4_CARIL|nr:hypothetical protein CIPAW_14G113100 [Carya illinoinensis]
MNCSIFLYCPSFSSSVSFTHGYIFLYDMNCNTFEQDVTGYVMFTEL